MNNASGRNVIQVLENRMATKDEKQSAAPKERLGQNFARVLVGEEKLKAVILWKNGDNKIDIVNLKDRGSEIGSDTVKYLENFGPFIERLNRINKYHREIDQGGQES